MMKLNELRDVSFEIAKSKGWHDADAPRATLSDRCALIVSELSEALEEYRGGHPPSEIYFSRGATEDQWSTAKVVPEVDSGAIAIELATSGRKPEGIPIELADVCIRIGDLAGRHELNLDLVAERDELVAEAADGFDDDYSFNADSLGDWLMLATAYTVRAWSGATIDGRPSDGTTANLIRVVLVMRAMAKKFEFDLDAAIAIKHAFNRTRPFRHGGKKI